MDDIVSEVKAFILRQFLQGEDPAQLTPSTPLISGAILDSLATLELIAFLEQRFNVEFEAHEVDHHRLDTLASIAELVRSKVSAKA